MSKMGNAVLELQEQAEELGFDNLAEAQAAGCTLDLINKRLLPPPTQWLIVFDDMHTGLLSIDKPSEGEALELLASKYDMTYSDMSGVYDAATRTRGCKLIIAPYTVDADWFTGKY